jgi:hypothetical protein
MNNKRKDKAVAEIIGTVLLLAVAVSVIAVIYFQVLSDEGPSPTNIVRVVGKGEGGYIYLEHMGGDDINLDNSITYTIAGYTYPLTTIRDLLENEKPLNDIYWSIGERLKIPIRYNLEKLDEYQIAEITAVDSVSNSIIFYGPISLPQPTSDLGIDIDVEYLDGYPVQANYRVQIIITLTSYGGNVNGSGGVVVNYQIPPGLIYNNSYSPTGHNKEPYNNVTGNWNAGNILVGYPAVLKINLTVDRSIVRIPTQLALVIDGSGSIGNTWFKWYRAYDQKHSGSYSVKSDNSKKGNFICNDLNTSDANSITVDFWYRLAQTEGSDFRIYYYDGTNWDYITELGGGERNTWLHYTHTINDPQYFKSNFTIRFQSNIDRNNEYIWIDDVSISTDSRILLDDGFEGEWWKWHVNWQPCDWDLIRIGLTNALLNSSIFPHDESIELTVIQFGTSVGSNLGYSKVEISPTMVVDSAVAKDLADDIVNLSQGIGGTPIAGGIYLTTDQLYKSNNFNESHRQAIILITDGVPNYCSSRPFSTYPDGPYPSSYCNPSDNDNAKISAEAARNDTLNTLNMTDDLDEFNCLAVGVGGMYGAPDVNWLNSSIVWPNPYIWSIESPDSFSGPGWVSTIESFQEFGFAINEMFTALFSIHNTVNFVSSTTYDPNPGNHKATVTIG